MDERMMDERMINAKRLCRALWARSEDECVMKMLSQILDYMPDQLYADINALYDTVSEVSQKSDS